MEWLNSHAGLLVLIFSVILVLLVGLVIWLVASLRSKIAVQRLKFIGLYSTNPDTRAVFAKITVGNRSLNDVGISEIGIKNGKVNFDFTPLYKAANNIAQDKRVIVEQRSAIDFVLPAHELCKVLIDGKNGKKVLKTLRVYAVDVTGLAYQGKIPAVHALLKDIIASGSVEKYLDEQAAKKAAVQKVVIAPEAAPAPKAESKEEPKEELKEESVAAEAVAADEAEVEKPQAEEE